MTKNRNKSGKKKDQGKDVKSTKPKAARMRKEAMLKAILSLSFLSEKPFNYKQVMQNYCWRMLSKLQVSDIR